ncbi:unnamed protein product [Closterium sp. NIES-54]
MGHPSISRLRAISSQRLVLGLPRVLPSLPPSLVPPCGPCVEGRLHATPHSSSLRPATEPFETLHLDVWGPASRLGLERESFFHVVVDNYSRYTTVFPLAKKSDVNSTLIWWLLTTADTRGRRVSCLHSNRGESPQQNGVAERRIGLVMEIARTSMTHARYPHTRAPHFLWPYAVWYAANQLNLWPHISRPEVSPTSLWTGSPCAESRIHVWGRLALVCDTSADKISPRAVPCVFLGFPEDSSDYTFYHPPLHRFVDSRDIRFDESVPYYPPSPQSSSQPTVDPTGAGFRGEDPGGASSRGAGVGAESIPVRGPGSGGAGVGAEPVSARESSLRGAGVSGAGVSGAVPGSATTGGAPSAGPGEPGTDPVTFGGAGCGGGATGSLESGPRATTAPGSTPPTHPYPTRHQARLRRTREEQLELEREERELERQQLELQQLEEQQQQSEQEQPQQQQPPPPPVSSLRTLGLPSPSPPSPPSPPVSGPPLPPPDPSPAVFPPPLPPLSPPLSHTWSSRRSPRARPSSPVPFTHLRTALFCSSPPRLSPSVLPSPPDSALTASLSTPITNYYRTYRPVLSLALASLVTDPRASLSSVSALIAEVTEFASTHCLDYATSLVAALPTNPLAVGGEFSLGCDALEDKQFELEFLAAASPHLCAMLLAPEGDPDALDIPTPRTYAEAVVKWPLGSPPVFKARYLARGFSQREGVDFFQTFAPTSKMTTLWVLLHVAAQSDYELHSLDFSTAFLQGSLHEEVWRPVYGLRQAPREWHDTLRSTISDLGFQPSSADPSLFVRHGSTPFFVLVYIDDLVFATADKVDLADVKLEQQKRHSCTDLGELRHYLGLQITKDRATRTITLSQSHMVQQVLQRFELQHSNVQRTPLAVDHKLTGPFPDEPFEPSGPYAELVGCLMETPSSSLDIRRGAGSWREIGRCAYWSLSTCSSSVPTSSAEAEIYAGAMVAQELRWMTFLHTDLSEWPSSAPTLFTDNKATILLCQDPRLESEVKYINGSSTPTATTAAATTPTTATTATPTAATTAATEAPTPATTPTAATTSATSNASTTSTTTTPTATATTLATLALAAAVLQKGGARVRQGGQQQGGAAGCKRAARGLLMAARRPAGWRDRQGRAGQGSACPVTVEPPQQVPVCATLGDYSPGSPPATPTAPSAVTSISTALVEQLVARINALESHQAMSINGSSYARGVAGLPLPGEDRCVNSERSFTYDSRQASAPAQDSQHRTQSITIATMQTKFVLTSKLKTSFPFDGKDFYTWSFEFELLATTAQIWMYYDGSLPFPTEGTIQEKNQCYHEYFLAYTTLLRNLSPSEQRVIHSYKSMWAPAYASWEHLRNSYMATDPSGLGFESRCMHMQAVANVPSPGPPSVGGCQKTCTVRSPIEPWGVTGLLDWGVMGALTRY